MRLDFDEMFFSSSRRFFFSLGLISLSLSRARDPIDDDDDDDDDDVRR